MTTPFIIFVPHISIFAGFVSLFLSVLLSLFLYFSLFISLSLNLALPLPLHICLLLEYFPSLFFLSFRYWYSLFHTPSFSGRAFSNDHSIQLPFFIIIQRLHHSFCIHFASSTTSFCICYSPSSSLHYFFPYSMAIFPLSSVSFFSLLSSPLNFFSLYISLFYFPSLSSHLLLFSFVSLLDAFFTYNYLLTWNTSKLKYYSKRGAALVTFYHYSNTYV